MSPEKLAANLIDEYCIGGPDQLNVEDIANAENLFIVERPLKNFLGMINYKHNYGLITISRDLPGTQKSREHCTYCSHCHRFCTGSFSNRLPCKVSCSPDPPTIASCFYPPGHQKKGPPCPSPVTCSILTATFPSRLFFMVYFSAT